MSVRTILSIALIMGLLVTAALAADEVVPFFGGEGATKCSVWLRERKSSTSIFGYGLDRWLMGFISGNTYTKEISDDDRQVFYREMTESDVRVRTDAFCKDHPDAYMLQAALSVSAELGGELAKRIRAAIDKAKRAR